MKILGIDASLSSTGYNIMDYDGNVLTYGTICTTTKNTEFERMYLIALKIDELIKEYNVTIVVLENSFFGKNPNTGIKLARLMGNISFVCLMNELQIELIAPTTCRKILLGQGKSSKEDVANYIRENIIDVGIYSDKTIKSKGIEKTSDVYDSIALNGAWLKQHKLNEKYGNK